MAGYGKNDRANIDSDDLRTYRSYGAFLQGLDDTELDSALGRGTIVEIER